MKLKILASLAGVSFMLNAGQTVDMDIDEARRLVDAGFAEALEPFPVTPDDQPVEPPVGNIETTDNQAASEQAVADPDPELAVAEDAAVEKRVKAKA